MTDGSSSSQNTVDVKCPSGRFWLFGSLVIIVYCIADHIVKSHQAVIIVFFLLQFLDPIISDGSNGGIRCDTVSGIVIFAIYPNWNHVAVMIRNVISVRIPQVGIELHPKILRIIKVEGREGLSRVSVRSISYYYGKIPTLFGEVLILVSVTLHKSRYFRRDIIVYFLKGRI